MNAHARLFGLLIGCAMGDAIGLPAEGMSRAKIQRRWCGVWRHRLLFGRGLVSDDAEHTWIVAECLIQGRGDVERFRSLLAWKLRLWFAAVPPGIGLATARACLKLWVGVSPKKSGVRSAGNGPAMRSAIIGAFFHDDPERLDQFVRACTEITHSDPRALTGALAIARCAAAIARTEIGAAPALEATFQTLRGCGTDPEWNQILQTLESGLGENRSVAWFADEIGAHYGVSGYIYQTVPVAIYAWLRHGTDFRQALESVLNLGGDTDTVGAILGSLMGLQLGCDATPAEWIGGTICWPYSRDRLNALAVAIANGETGSAKCFCWWKQLLKNAVMLPVVLAHGFARLVW